MEVALRQGKPTIYDKDLIIYVISQIAAATNKGHHTAQDRGRSVHDPGVHQRGTGGRDYDAVLRHDRATARWNEVRTNVKTGSIQTDTWFGMLESVELKTTNEQTGKLLSLTITVSEWLANAIETRDLLTLNADYFRLRRPLERRLRMKSRGRGQGSKQAGQKFASRTSRSFAIECQHPASSAAARSARSSVTMATGTSSPTTHYPGR